MFALADRNLKSLDTCASLVASSGGAYAGVYIPAGRFYVRGVLDVPQAWRFIGYFCLGYPEAEHAEPELVFRMTAVCVRLGERGMAQDVDRRTAVTSSSMLLPSRAAARPAR